MKKDYNNYRKEKQRFSIVKVSGKTTSVLVGLTIFGGLLLDAPNAQADTTPSYEVASDTSSSTTATNSKEVTLSSTTDKANQASDQTVSSTSNESSQASATSVDNNEASSATSTTNNVATSDASTTSSDITVANNTNTTANDATNNSTTDNTVKVRTKRALPEASSTTNYDVDDIYNYYVSKGGTASKQKVQDLIDYKNNSSRVTAILNLTVDSYWVDQVLNKEVLNAQKFTDSYIDRIITTSGNSLVTTTNSKIDDQIAKLTELQQKYPNSKEVENAIEKLNETKNSVTLENVYNAEKMQDVIDTLNKYGSVSAYDDLEKAAENEQTSGSGELDNAKTDAKAAIDKLENLNDAQKAMAKEAVDNATTTADVTTAQNAATGLDNDMSGLKNSVSDVDTTKNGENYTNASEEAKKAYDEAVSNAQSILDKVGNNATSDEVAAAKKAVEDAKAGLDGTTNLSNAKADAQAAIDKLENLNDAQKAAAKEAVANATTTADVTTAQNAATGLDNDMSGLKNSVSDEDATKSDENYTNASESAKKAYDEAVSNAQSILDQAGNNATSDEVAVAKKAVEDAKTALDGTTNLSNAKNEAQAAIDKLENLNDAQKAAAKEAVDNATTTAEVTNAQTSATGLDNDMSDLKNSVSDVDTTKNGENYTNASEEAKKVYDEAVANAQAILDQAGNSATSDEVAAAKKAVEDAKTGLDGTSNLSNAKADAQAAIDKLENLNDAQKAGFIADVDAASSQQLVEQAVADAKALDSEMAKLRQEVESSNQVKDTTKYANSSDTLKKNYDDLLAVATALVSKNGIDANLATVQQLVSELKAARLALNGVDTKVETNNNTNVNKAKNSLSNKATASLKTTSLPQTGETKENTSLVGAMLATIGGVLGLGLTRRKKEDK
ncbi:LPXTG cell wall anchor domain-containing protein [Ligilactobacillus salivarius]|uniref:LPXTG cell wall anchor domain-containing protein n=3 Tax=Ligilactobacillus salivarius TaxID=1624 RepID=UPI0033152162